MDEVLAKVSLTEGGSTPCRRLLDGHEAATRASLQRSLGDPELLILDEPANGLDPEGVHWLRERLRGFARSDRLGIESRSR